MKKLLLVIGLLFFFSKGDVLAVDPTQFEPVSGQSGIALDMVTYDSTSQTVQFGRPNPSAGKVSMQITFDSSQYVCQVDFRIKKVGSPTDSVVLNVYEGGSSPTGGTLRYTYANAWLASDFSDSVYQWASFYYGTAAHPGNCPSFGEGVTYHFTLSRTGAENSTDRYAMEVHDTADPSGQAITDTDRVGSTHAPFVYLYGFGNTSSGNELIDTSTFCDNLGFLTSLCQNIVFLIFPNTSAVETEITDLYDDFAEKAPFGYVIEALDLDLSNVSTGSGVPTLSIPIDVHVAGNSTLDTTMDWTDSEGLNIVSNYATQIRTVLLIVIWLGFIFYLFVLVRHIL